MFGWIKSLLGLGENVAQAVTEAVKQEADIVEVMATSPKEAEPKKTSAKKTTAKKGKKGSGTCDFSKLTKTQLLKEAKHRGVKANASLSKAEILSRLKGK